MTTLLDRLKIVRRLNDLPLTHTIVRRLHLRPLANAALGAVPIVRTLPSGVKYRCRYLDTLTLADYIFAKRSYEGGIPKDVRTFVDLGCNVGHFVAFLADYTGRRDLRGLAVDASRDMIRETAWVIAENHLDGVAPVLGLIGGEAGSMGEFFLHPVSLLSSRYPEDEPGQPKKGDFVATRVPFVDLEAIWLGMLGDVPCDVLKIDIEGAEADFVKTDNPFFRRVKRVVVECHKWIIPAEELEARLFALGFAKRGVLDETISYEIAYYDRAGRS